MIAGSGSFAWGRGSVEISRGWFHLPHRSETSIWVWPIDQSALQALGTAGRSTSNTVMSFRLGAGEKRLVQPQGWTVGVLTETSCGKEARGRVNWFLVQHLLTYNMEHEWFSILVTLYHLELVGPRFESMTRILWRRLRQDDGRCQIASRLAVEGPSHYDRSAGPALPKLASPPRRLFPAPK